MSGVGVVYAMIWVLIAAFVMCLFSKQLKFLFRLVLRGFAGTAGIFALDFLLSSVGISVGINLFTACVTAFLGIPGFLLLYALAFLWR